MRSPKQILTCSAQSCRNEAKKVLKRKDGTIHVFCNSCARKQPEAVGKNADVQWLNMKAWSKHKQEPK